MRAMNHSAAKRKATIVLVAFGTSVDSARMVFEHIDKQVRKRYPDHDIHWGFTSQTIIRKLKERGIETRYIAEVVEDLRNNGITDIVFQSLHIVPGQEYMRVKSIDMTGLNVAYGDALMTTDEDIEAVIAALDKKIKANQATVIVAHGNENRPEFNERLLVLTDKIESRYPHLVVASVEGTPGTEPLERIRTQSGAIGSVHFVPLMIVAGDHVLNDVMGDDEDSWKNIVNAERSECSQSLGWDDDILDIYCKHLDKALKTLAS